MITGYLKTFLYRYRDNERDVLSLSDHCCHSMHFGSRKSYVYVNVYQISFVSITARRYCMTNKYCFNLYVPGNNTCIYIWNDIQVSYECKVLCTSLIIQGWIQTNANADPALIF